MSANTQHRYVDTHLSLQLGNLLFQNVDPLLVPITLEFNPFSIPGCGTILESLLGGFVGLQSVYELPFLPTNLILCRGFAWIAIEQSLYSPLFPLRLSRKSWWGWSLFYE